MNSRIIIILLYLLILAELLHGHDINGWRPLIPSPRHERPVDVMADVINNIGVKMLDCYVEHPGNVAFSPTGLTFVLAALYEGSAGHGNRQIAHCLGFPRDRRVTRIGLRDIHRRLRSYLNADAFLGGLTLNRDDIMLRPEYEDVLRFYGFDVGDLNAANRSRDDAINSTTVPTTLGMNTTNGNDSVTSVMTRSGLTDAPETTTAAETAPTTVFTAPSAIDMDLMGSTASMAMVTVPSVQVTPDTTLPMDATTTNPTVESIPVANSTDATEMSANLVNSSSTSSSIVDSSSSPPAETTEMSSAATIDTTTMSGGNIINEDTTTMNVSQGELTDMNNRTDGNQTRLIASGDANSTEQVETEVPTAASVTEELSEQSTVDSVASSDDNNVRKKRSIRRRSFPIYPDEPVWIDDLNDWQDYPSAPEDDLLGSTDQHTTQLNFLVHGCDISTISTTTYTAILPFAYFPSLHALGLEFPLDDPRYNVIIVVPTEGTDTRTLARLLCSTTLRHLTASMKPTWVRATIPSFMLRGFITLTPYLQKLGITDAFEPRTADLSPMSPDLGIYARDIQQSIGVNIRNYMKGTNDSQPRVTTARNTYNYPGDFLHTKQPIPFVVDRPFLFFIVDAETSVSLIAGRIDDPLNSRIN